MCTATETTTAAAATATDKTAQSVRQGADGSGSGSAGDRAGWTVRKTPQDAGLVPTLAVTLWLGWMGGLVYLGLYLILFASSATRLACLGLCTASLVAPRYFPGKRLGTRIGDWILGQAEKYFGLKTTVEDEEALRAHDRSGRAVVYALEPHDVLPYGAFAFNPPLKRVPGSEKLVALMTSATFRVPFMRQVYSWVGGYPIDRHTFRSRLENSQSFVFCPGGVQEVTMMDPSRPDDVIMFLRSRKGFVKLALETGSPIVPVFAFGMDGSYDHWIPRGKWVNAMSRRMGFVPVMFSGRFGVPFGIPKPRSVRVVIGRPIDVPREGDEVRAESVDRYHSKFLEEMEALYERHKHDEGYGDRKLVIL